MQMHLVNRGAVLTIPVLNVMNTAHYIAACMMQTGAEGDQYEYDTLAYMRLGHDAQVAMLAIMVLTTMLKRTDGQRARQCRNVLMEDRNEDFYEGLSLYERFISSSERRFEEQDFLTDTMRQICDLQNTIQQLTLEKQQLKQQIETMSKTPKHQTTVYNYGTYNDIHDNPHATIYATAQTDIFMPVCQRQQRFNSPVLLRKFLSQAPFQFFPRTLSFHHGRNPFIAFFLSVDASVARPQRQVPVNAEPVLVDAVYIVILPDIDPVSVVVRIAAPDKVMLPQPDPQGEPGGKKGGVLP